MPSADRGAGPNGIAVIDKPAGWTSHDVVAKSRGVLGTKKVGHSGTLDPDATGVLLLGVGTVTRLLRFLSPLAKSYTCEIVLGVETSTLDAAGDVTATHAMSVSLDDVRAAASALTGDLQQVPPMVSAVSIGGKRLHELARQGIEVEREARPVTVHVFDIDATDDPLVFRASVECSSGTYVRSLADDLGHALGGGAHLRALRRTAIGFFTEAMAHPLETPELLPPIAAVEHLPRLDVPRDHVAVGGIVPGDSATGDGPWAVVDGDELLAVYERSRDRIKPAVVVLRPT
ncbi:MAG: tRNA pseudouridine55 synthase [Actinomycetota bacterium]|nr:tRNA pseudouridine55 synthase [Actinomycetota bacterium]